MICDRNPRILSAVPVIPPRLVRRIIVGRLQDVPQLIAAEVRQNLILLGDQPMLAVTSGKQELVVFLAFPWNGPLLITQGTSRITILLSSSKIISRPVPVVARRNMPHQSPTTAVDLSSTSGRWWWCWCRCHLPDVDIGTL